MDISQSIKAVLNRDQVVADLFYTIFIDRYPDVRAHFEGVDLQQQSVMLTMSLLMIEQYFQHKYPAAEQYLKVIGHRHSQRGIPTDLYPQWRDCLLETLGRFHGDQWNDSLEAQWKEAVELAADRMCGGYGTLQIY